MAKLIEYYRMQLAAEDAAVMVQVVNLGIDSRLEGFTQSKFRWHDHFIDGSTMELDSFVVREELRDKIITRKLHCHIHPDEMQILLRRLLELAESGDEVAEDVAYNADSMADVIVEHWYDQDMGLGLIEEEQNG